jgi:phage-related protein
MGVITFNGQSSSDYGILVEHPPGYHIPTRDYEYIHVPGRNGDLIIDKGSFQNGRRSYEIAFGDTTENYAEMASKVANWLHSASGYAELSDTYEGTVTIGNQTKPKYFRLASYVDEVDIENILFHAGRAEIEFNCKPQRYLTSGTYKEEMNFSSGSATVTIPLILERYKAYFVDPTTNKVTSEDVEWNYATAVISVKPNEVYTYTGRVFNIETPKGSGTSNQYSLIAMTDDNEIRDGSWRKLNAITDQGIVTDTITIPQGATKLVVQSYVRTPTLKVTRNTAIIENEQNFASLPLINVFGSGVGQYIILNGTAVCAFTELDAITNPLTIDSDIQDVYQNKANKNGITVLPTGEFPKLLPGENTIAVSSGITKLEITPRWWTL